MIDRIIQRFDRRGLSDYVDIIGDMWQSGKPIKLTAEFHEPDITDKQFKALHVWCRQCEQSLNKAMFYRKDALTGTERAWQEGDFKHYIYKPFIKIYKKKFSTKDQNTSEPSEVCLALSGHFSTEHNVQLPPWPSFR